MYIITKEFHFSASHYLPSLPEGHPCTRMHGHNYIVIVELQSETLNEHGFVREYAELNQLKEYIDDKFDHRLLNEVLDDTTVSSECLAKHFYDWCAERWPETTAVKIIETPKVTAEYRPKK